MSSNGYYELILQENGNLEITCATEIKIWESNTKGKNIDGLYFAKGGVALYQNGDTKGSAWSAGPWRRNTGLENLLCRTMVIWLCLIKMETFSGNQDQQGSVQ